RAGGHPIGIRALADHLAVHVEGGPAAGLLAGLVGALFAYPPPDGLLGGAFVVELPRPVLQVIGIVAFIVGVAIGEPAAPEARHAPGLETAHDLLLAVLEPAGPLPLLPAIDVGPFLQL